MQKILIGTTNPSKVQRFRELLRGLHVQVLTPPDLDIKEEPEETGKTPLENARIKAAFYGRFCERVICNDSGLYFLDLPVTDPRQPGLHIRTPQGVRLNDDEMIAYYASLVHELGGKVTAGYLDAIATNCSGTLCGLMKEEHARDSAFAMVDVPHEKRHPGWPLDSISVRTDTGLYFVESPRGPVQERFYDEMRSFICASLQLEEKA